MCAVNEINAAIPIKCVPFNRTSGIWIVDYEVLFEVGIAVVVVVAAVVDVKLKLTENSCSSKKNLKVIKTKKKFPYRELNPGLLGESQLS